MKGQVQGYLYYELALKFRSSFSLEEEVGICPGSVGLMGGKLEPHLVTTKAVESEWVQVVHGCSPSSFVLAEALYYPGVFED